MAYRVCCKLFAAISNKMRCSLLLYVKKYVIVKLFAPICCLKKYLKCSRMLQYYKVESGLIDLIVFHKQLNYLNKGCKVS